MKMKLSKARFAAVTEQTDNDIRISDGHMLPFYLKAGKHTKADFVTVNVSTADVECLVMRFGESGVRIAGRDNRFRCFNDPMWRE